MNASQVKKIVDRAKALGLEKNLVAYTDNEYIVHLNSDTSTGYFDHDNELLWIYKTNNNPLEAFQGECPMILASYNYDHIVEIDIEIPKNKTLEVIKTDKFDNEKALKIISVKTGEAVAKGYTRKFDVDGNEID